MWWGWSMFFPSDWRPNVTSWNLLAQFHPPASSDSATCQPNISLGTDGPETLFVRSEGGPSCVDDQKQTTKFAVGELGRWHRLVLHIRFSSGDDGLLEAWWDGSQVASIAGPTLYGQLGEAYGPMIGIYQGGTGAVAQTVFYDYVVSGRSRVDVESVPRSSD